MSTPPAGIEATRRGHEAARTHRGLDHPTADPPQLPSILGNDVR